MCSRITSAVWHQSGCLRSWQRSYDVQTAALVKYGTVTKTNAVRTLRYAQGDLMKTIVSELNLAVESTGRRQRTALQQEYQKSKSDMRSNACTLGKLTREPL